MAKGTHHHHAAPTEPVIEVVLDGIQVARVGLHKPGEQGVGCITGDAYGHVHVPDHGDAVRGKSAGVRLQEQA